MLSLPVDAQTTTARLDLSGSRVRYAESTRSTALSITPEITAEWPTSVFRAVASYSSLSEGESALSGHGGFSLYTPTVRNLLGELEAFAGGTRVGDLTTSQLQAVARGHLSAQRGGVWIGGGAGTASSAGTRRPSRLAEAGVWARYNSASASVTVSPTVVDDSIRFTDLNVVAVAALSRLELTASAGSRSGSQPEIFGTPVKAWASASASAWLTDRIAIIAGAGRYPVDLTQGFPGGTYASIGLRIATRLSTGPEAPPAPAPPPPAIVHESGAGPLQVSPAGIGRRLLFIHAPAARSVEISGAFTNWTPTALEQRADGWWSLELALQPGRYEVALRIDGANWIAPPGLLAVRDEFGGEVGLLDVQ